MQYRAVKILSKVRALSASNHGLVVKTTDNQLVHHEEILGENVTSFGFSDNYLVFVPKEWELNVVDIQNGSSEKVANASSAPEVIHRDHCIITEKDNGSFKKFWFDLKSKRKIFELDHTKTLVSIIFLENHFIINKDNCHLQLINTETGTLIWESDVNRFEHLAFGYEENMTEKYRIRKILGHGLGNIYVVVKQRLMQTLLEINALDGSLQRKWRQVNTDKNLTPNHLLPLPAQACIIEAEKLIVGLVNQVYWELDLDSGQINTWDLSEEFEHLKLSVRPTLQLTLVNPHIFFCSRHLKGPITHKIAAFNRQTKKIDWTYEFDFPSHVQLQSPAPVIQGDHLYVLDSAWNLHIFEREK